jgi:hypothetical protein
MYNSSQTGRFSDRIYCCATVGKGEDLLYCIDTKKSKHCFGCVNMKEKEYCIFNKQYTKENYELLVPRLIERMRQAGQWWNFFPSSCSIFPYNDTMAYDIYPIHALVYPDGREEVVNQYGKGIVRLQSDDATIVPAMLDLGGTEMWPITRRVETNEINIPEGIVTLDASDLPHIDTVSDNILQQAILCEQSGRPFRIVPMELAFYRKHQLPLPRRHPDVRYVDKLAQRPSRDLQLSTCAGCSQDMVSVYGQDEAAHCEHCYQQRVYG